MVTKAKKNRAKWECVCVKGGAVGMPDMKKGKMSEFNCLSAGHFLTKLAAVVPLNTESSKTLTV